MGAWQLDRVGPVARLTLLRPPVNALDLGALDELAAAVAQVAGERSARTLVVSSGLEGVFCTGGDLKYWRNVHDGRKVSESGRSVFERLGRLEIATIAAVNGSVVGDGLTLALACDLRIASEASSFRLPELAYGFIPGWGPIGPLVGLVGRAVAADMLLTGRTVRAAEALRVGLVHDVVSPERLEEAVVSRASSFAAVSASALRAAKCVLRGGDERACFQGVWGGGDWEEGIAALFARRTPRFGREE